MLLTSAPPRSDLSKQPCYTYAEMHNPIFSSFPGHLVGWWSHICKSFTWDELHEVSVLYNPPRLKGFPNFLSLYPLDLPPGSKASGIQISSEIPFISILLQATKISYAPPRQFFFAYRQKLHLKVEESASACFPISQSWNGFLHMMVSLFLDESHNT